MWKEMKLTTLILLNILLSTDAMTIEKQIFSSAPNAPMFNLFHLMPEGDVKVMTEFDLLLTLEQFESMYRGGSVHRNKRKAIRDVNTRWTDCKVYYEIMDDLLEDEKSESVIKEAMADWEKYTCLEFKPDSSKPTRIQFRNGGGCYSQLGMQNSPQPIALARGCRTKGVVAHEIGHAIGFIHEHMRPDRDRFVMVNFKAIPERFHSNYHVYNSSVINTYGVPYDYTSLMHYGSTVIPNSIKTLDESYQEKIGQREGLTFKDIKLANLMYRCAKVMGCKRNNCPDEGFQFYKNYKNEGRCQCWCNSGNIKDPLVLCSDSTRRVITPPEPKTTLEPVEPPPMECMDMHPDCEEFKARGNCMTEMELMMDVCAKTCDYCGKGKGMCMDHEKSCRMAAAAGFCKNGFKVAMETLCRDSCGLCKKPPDPCDIMKEMLGDQTTGGNGAMNTMKHSDPVNFFMFLMVFLLVNAKLFLIV